MLEKYSSSLHDLMQSIGKKLVEGMEMEMGMEGEILKNFIFHLKINKYSHGPETVGLTSGQIHTDPGFITLLQDGDDPNGLETTDKITGEFVSIDHIPGSLVVILGDVAEVWSNGRFFIPEHRVQCHAPTVRTSIAYFAYAPKDEKVATPLEMVDSDHPLRYAPFEFQEYLTVRQSTFSICGEALQHFLSKNP